jgi:DNA-binding response OmpR family regulator
MRKLLVVDDEEAIRKLIRLNLGEKYEIVDTGVPEDALAIALEQKPDAILLDLRMPKYSGFDLCQRFAALSATMHIPLVVISGEAGAKTKDFCRELGVAAYFEKPIDFDGLSKRLVEILKNCKKERRREVRVGLRVPLRLELQSADGNNVEILTISESVSPNGFLFACEAILETNSMMDVYLTDFGERVGTARIMRSELAAEKNPQYDCRFVQKTGNWVLQ